MKKNPYSRLQPKTRKPYTNVYLIRHANPDYSLEKKVGDRLMPLSLEGRKQARELTKALSKLNIDSIYTSSLVRAQETASYFTKRCHLDIKVEEGLDEINWKAWHRVKYFRTSEERRRQSLSSYRVLDKQLDKMQTHTRRILSSIFEDNRGKNVAVFCHGNIIKAFLTGIMDADVLGFLSLEVYQASISQLVIDRDAYVKIACINNFNHLTKQPKEDLFITLVD